MSTLYICPINNLLGLPERLVEWDEEFPEDAEFSHWSGYIPDAENQRMITEKARIRNTGRKRPEHSEKMKKLYAEGKLKMPRGQAKGKRTGKALENIRAGVRKRYGHE